MTAVTSEEMRSSVRPSDEDRIVRLNSVSEKRLIDPEVALTGSITKDQVIPDRLLSICDLDLDLTEEQKQVLAREEVGSMLKMGIRFEAILMAGFALAVAKTDNFTDPRIVYLLHEMGEETRHSRVFIRLLGQLETKAVEPFRGRFQEEVFKRVIRYLVTRPAPLFSMVVAGEEIPDLVNRMIGEDPESDPYLAAVNRYHRQEEARHLAYARIVLPDLWRSATPYQRYFINSIAPILVWTMFTTLVHPGVYERIGLPAMATWKQVNDSPTRIDLRRIATRPILKSLTNAGAIDGSRIPKGWRKLCGVTVDGHEKPLRKVSPSI